MHRRTMQGGRGVLLVALGAGGLWAAGRMPAGSGPASAPAVRAAGIEPRAHDPAMIKQGDTYYVYFTGGGINVLTSKDLVHWQRAGVVFPRLPGWIATEVPGARGLWAPDISFFGGKYHLYYAASTFGKNRSCIGLATNVTLDPTAKDYKWEDQGKVVESQTTDRFNAIDPNMVMDDKGVPWLCFGSFWSGIKLRKLVAETGMLDPGDTQTYAIAARGGDRSIEGPFIVRREGFYYLFVSFDRCCQGLRSTYRVMVGRSAAITGPYVDKAGKAMMEGGGTEILAGDGKRIIGPGHCAVVKEGERWLLVHHFYDGEDNGVSKLQVREMRWDGAGWPVVGGAVAPVGENATHENQ